MVTQTSAGPEAAPSRPVDWGKVVLVPVFGVLLALNVVAMATAANRAHGAAAVAASVTVSVLTVAFYVLVITAYLRRGPARATSASLPVRLAAVAATFLPLTLPALGVRAGTGLDVAASVLVLTGMVWCVWALSALGRNLSVVPQARGLARTGPYRWVRHPLYVGEIVATLGIAVRGDVWAGYVAWAVLVVLQAYRATAEERLLRGTLPGYDAYAAQTARLVPGLF